MTKRAKHIKTVEDLHQYLKDAMKIEHATLPPYLTALYSLKPGSNLEAFHMIRAIAVEEMLHLTLVVNVFNAVGGNIEGVLTDSEFVPHYPTYLPTGATDFQVNVEKFSREALETFCNIERSEDMKEESSSDNVSEEEPSQPKEFLLPIFGSCADGRKNQPEQKFFSIGQFYQEVIDGFMDLYEQEGQNLFSSDSSKQISREYYYNGAGEIVKVTNLDSALKALYIIQNQGEGSRKGEIYDSEKKLCHYYRFQQLELGRYYVIDESNPINSDQPDNPTGDSFTVDWDAVYPVLENAKLSDYPQGSQLYTHGQEFQKAYSKFLAQIEKSFDGNPKQLIPAVGEMFRLKELANSLIRNPIPGKKGVNGAPIYR